MMTSVLIPLFLGLVPVQAPIHAMDAERHQAIPSVLDRKVFELRDGELQVPAAERFNRTIYGYYPYWADHDDNLPWEHLTHLAYFCVALNPDGTLGDDHSWSTRGAALVEAGHSHGVKVLLTVTMFESSEIREVLSTPENRARAIDNLLALVQDAGGDGINIDFEFVPSAEPGESPTPKENFVTFMTDLTTAFHAAIEDSHVSLATPAIDWGGTYDYDALALATDGLMIMGYGYHWSGGNPGPVSPVVGGGIWGSYSLTWTVEDYFTYGGEENRNRFILGLPLYGRQWPTTDLNIPGTATGSGPAKSLAQCDSILNEGKLWDETTSTPYKIFMDGNQPNQLFCEDIESLRAKFALIESYDLGGVMFWDVGKVDGQHPVWSEASNTYSIPIAPEEPEPEEPQDSTDPAGEDESDPSDASGTESNAPSDDLTSDASDASDSEGGGCQAVQGDALWSLLIFLGLLNYRRRPAPTICEALH